ncbi:hypothetical protein CC80DRAFT_51258 [Byssothecium circinans]|uniref:Uncharacterized protein n=1 Tax=Byssothecium circinans TaxID=147558 RepID=A0A6A5TWA4_9PLEO|nr:hypothetical protein CC80DRAFT_51258 [Byssothecium circinans]
MQRQKQKQKVRTQCAIRGGKRLQRARWPGVGLCCVFWRGVISLPRNKSVCTRCTVAEASGTIAPWSLMMPE